MAEHKRSRFSVFLCLVACLLLHVTSVAPCDHRQKKTLPNRVLPGMQSFPSSEEFENLARSLNGSMVSPKDPAYTQACSMYNLRVVARPYAIYYVSSVDDVQKVIVFAKQYNLWVSVRSSGHSFIGRSTGDNTIVINLGKMKGRKFNLNSSRSEAGEITVESGITWIEVYRAVDELVTHDATGNAQRRVIVGGSGHTVAMGGYTQGGGHSPICRELGLAVDNLLEATIVLANGTKAVVNEQGTTLTDLSGQTTFTEDTSLFWAIRGGGGSTWGVVVNFTFKLHFAPQRFRNILVNWALYYRGYDIGTETIKFVVRQLSQLSKDWGGYMIVNGMTLTSEATGSLTLFLNHWGSDNSSSNSEIDAILTYNVTKNQYGKVDRKFNTFLEYEVNAKDKPYVYTYVIDSFIQPTIVNDNVKLSRFAAFLMGLKNAPSIVSGSVCTGAMIGGKIGEVASGVTPVSPKFRSGLMAMSCGLGWSEGSSRDDFYITHALKMRDALAEVGEGVFFSEPPEDLDDWKVQFWGDASNYQRLLDAKRKWDPNNFFWCHNCVGSDLDATYSPIRDDGSKADEAGCMPSSSSPRSASVLSALEILLLVRVLHLIVW